MPESNKPIFILIDGNAILHRSFHAMPAFSSRGKLVNAVYGFISILFATIRKFEPEYIAVAFDVKAPTLRKQEYAQYKAKRVKPPQEFYDQIPLAYDFLKAMEIPAVMSEGYEADDVIAVIAKHVVGELKDSEVIIVTGDRDALQLIDKRTKVAMPKLGPTKEMVYDRQAVLGKYGIEPTQIVDWKALAGDSSDNIPGVPGVGDKTAVGLLQKYKDLAGIYANIGEIKSSQPKLAEKLENGKESAEFSKKLVQLCFDCPIDFALKNARVHDFSHYKVEEFLDDLGFKSLIGRMPVSHRHSNQQQNLL